MWIAAGFWLLAVSLAIFYRLHVLGKGIGKDIEDVWVGGLPTLAPGDDNQNEIKFRINANSVPEYYRKAKR